MACGTCGGGRVGYDTVWQVRRVGQRVKEFDAQPEAEAFRQANGGIVVKATVKKPA